MPVGLRDRRTWRRRGPPARTLVIGTDARYWHQRALSAPTRVVDMSARYIPLAVSTTPSQCRQRASVSATSSQCRQPTPVSATSSQCRQRAPTPVPGECPSPASDCSSEGLCPPRAWGIPSGGGEHHGMPRMPLVLGGCPIFCCSGRNETKDAPSRLGIACARPRVRGTPARGRADRASALSRPDARGNARTRQGWSPVRLPPGCPPPLGYAHKNPGLQNTHRAQGGDPALVRGPVFPNSLPCVRY